MSEAKFKTMRHIETVRNYLTAVARHFTERGQNHDQSKLMSPEAEIFEVYTSKLRNCTYASDEYKQNMKEMRVAIDHHNSHNRHHPEHWNQGIKGMNLFDLIEMLVDWKSAGMRHADGDIRKSIEINKERFGFSDEIAQLLNITMDEIVTWDVQHRADES